jgi:hypothetical protein
VESPLLATHFIEKLNQELSLSLAVPAKQNIQKSIFDSL